MSMQHRTIRLVVNGTPYELDVPMNRMLLDVLRHDLHMTGTKRACNEGECGSCTVHMDGRSVNACLVLAVEADGSSITTIEGIETDGRLHPLQQAFIDEGAVQCGYCTPGMIMQALDLLSRNPNPSEQEIKDAMVGNLCRCTGYEKIIRAITKVSMGVRQERLQMIKEAVRRKDRKARPKKKKAKEKKAQTRKKTTAAIKKTKKRKKR
jgi:aerobic-type carbon monoxide dehydrogenase small subunit (CoxS/CutS family)